MKTHRFSRGLRIATLALALPALGCAATVQDFDFHGQGTAYAVRQTLNPPGPVLLSGGPTGSGRYLRLVSQGPQPGPPTANTITFAVTDAAPAQAIVAEFDFRMVCGATRGDGFGFALLDTASYPGATVEPDRPPSIAEEPGYTRSIGVGFDIFANPATPGLPADIAHDGIRARFSSSISLHFDKKFLAQVDTVPVTDLANGRWLRARVIVRVGRVAVQLAATPGVWVTLLDRAVPGLRPYEARAHFAGRGGGETADVELDNVSVNFLAAGESTVSCEAAVTEVVEEAGTTTVQLTRTGDLSRAVTVAYATTDGSASVADFTPASGTVTFPARQARAAISVPILDDAIPEAAETFTLTLSLPAGGAVLGSARATVRILDDETAAVEGRWSEPFNIGATGVHTALLPDGRVLLFDRIGNYRLWDPATRAVSRVLPPPGGANLFCSGHSFLPDGTLLVAGGHDDLGHGPGGAVGGGEHDGFGLATAFRFVAATQRWVALPKMRAGRWYPTNTTLANGDVLVLSGSVVKNSGGYIQNTLPEIWEIATGRWRSLPTAQQQQVNSPFPHPQGVDLYPRMFLLPDARVLKVGADLDTWILDPADAGNWSPSLRRVLETRTYGAAVMYESGKILYVGGANPPTASAEVFDVNAATPAWRQVGSMREPRRQLNATTLPDGSVLATGGSRNSGGDADGVSSPVLLAELWSPATELWSPMAAMDIARLYHSTALLLPDGRVLSLGGGHSGASTSFHNEAEIFSPPYLFRGPRPAIAAAPTVLTYGQRFLLQTPDAAAIRSACLIRLAAVTHSFDQNARRVALSFTARAGALEMATPSASAVAPPGHYLLFIVNADGVPSVARIVNLAVDLSGGTFRGLVSASPASQAAAGLVQLVVTSQRSFTATLVFGGKSFTVRGAFDALGDFATTLPGATPLSVQFSLETVNGAPFISGRISGGGATGTFTAGRNFSPTHAAPAAGYYTVWLPRSADLTAPQGHGSGALAVSSAGSGRLVMTLGDGTVASFGATLPRSLPWPIYIPLDRAGGSLSGALTFRDVPGTSHVDGRLAWFRSGVFATEVELRGSRYTAPPRGVRVLDFPDLHRNAVLQIVGGNLNPAVPDKTLSLGTDHRVFLHGSEPFSLTITLRNGLFTGRFQDPATGRLHAFQGAVIQESRLGAGFFRGNAATGSVELRPTP